MKNARRIVLSTSLLAFIVWAQSLGAFASTAPGLGTAGSFAILAGTTVTNTGPSVISGSIGVAPGTAITGFPTGQPVVGTREAGTAAATTAKTDLTAAYLVAASSPCNFNMTGINLGGLTLTPGTYCQTTAPTLTGTLTLSGNGVFIFQIGSTLVTAPLTGPGSKVVLTNGAQPCNVFWQVSSSATLDTGTQFVGTIMALASISLNDGATILDGRALAQTGAVTLINNKITAPTPCAATTVAGPTALNVIPTPTPAPTPVPTVAPTAAATGLPNASAEPPAAGGGGFPWNILVITTFLSATGVLGAALIVRRQRRTTR